MNEGVRPSPEALLAAARREQASAGLGRLKIFLGMCPGVGKTYAMLLAAQQQQEDGRSVLVGAIETHGRVETLALTTGLSRAPRRQVTHRGVVIEEMDVDALLAQRPDLVIVDELAHTNAPGSRHPKRFQDVIELIEAGIDVFTTVNVQHVESQRDVVAQITGITVHETVPDSLLDRADEIELVDISPEQLRKRLDEGKVYLGDRAAAAAENFFREGNLKALREIALRLSADRADRDLRSFLETNRASDPWKSRERLIVAVGASPYSGRLIRWTRRMAAGTHATWVVVFVDTGRSLSDEERDRLEQNLTLARTLGAEVFSLAGADVAETLIEAARQHNATQIVVGKPLNSRIADFLQGGSLADKLIRRSGEIDVYVVRAEKSASSWRPGFPKLDAPAALREFGLVLLSVCAVTVAGFFLRGTIGYMAVGLLYLLTVLLASTVFSRWPILLFGALTALAWNYFFISPFFTFSIQHAHDLILFLLYFIVAIVAGQLHARLRLREQAERRRERQAVTLYSFARDVAQSPSLEAALRAGVSRIDMLFGVETAVVVPNAEGVLGVAAGYPLAERELGIARWTFDKNQPAGRHTATLPQSEFFFLPMHASSAVVGVLAIKARSAPLLAERQMMETFAAQIALLVEREGLRHEAEVSRIEEASRQLQKTLLDGVSHEFKTPLAVITSASESLLSAPAPFRAVIEEIRVAAIRLNRIVGNLLDMTRIETGTVRPKLEWCDLQEIIDASVARIRPEMGERELETLIAEEVSACQVDSALLEEILSNLLRNGFQHGTIVRLQASLEDRLLVLRVSDDGPGLAAGTEERLFEKFQRGSEARAGGLGLGLSIVRGLAEALGGTVAAGNNPAARGAWFEIRLPIQTRNANALVT